MHLKLPTEGTCNGNNLSAGNSWLPPCVVFKGPVRSGLLTKFRGTRTRTALGPGPGQLGPGPDCSPGPILVLHRSRTDPDWSKTVVSPDQSLTGLDQSLH